VGCQMSEPPSHWVLPRVKPLSSHPDISITASSIAARALLSVFCKGLFKNVETNIPQELNISPQGEEKSYKNIYHSAQGQGRGKSETERGGKDGSCGRTRPNGKGRTRGEWGKRNSRRGEITRRETVVQDRSGKQENSVRGKTTGKKE